jgi:hypothetical protein
MVRALLDGRKTQTRRIVKPANLKVNLPRAIHGDWPIGHHLLAEAGIHSATMNQFGAVSVLIGEALLGVKPDEYEWVSPYGKPGNRLWVRETWTGTWNDTAVHLHYAADGSERMAGEAPTEYVLPKAAAKVDGWVTPLFMPRWASRITLEIAEVRVQRLQEITPSDVLAEGVELGCTTSDFTDKLTPAFRRLWESIHGADSWEANPWVWALTFERVQA